MKLYFGMGDLVVKGFSNAYFIRDQDDRKSTCGHFSFLVVRQFLGQVRKKHVLLDI